MREILFRGKRIDNGEWVQGYFFQIWERVYILWGTTNGHPDMVAVDPATVGQYTGLKDKNGKRISEGDVVLSCGSEEVVSYGIQEVDAFEGMGFNLWSFFDDDGNGYKANGVRLQSELEVIGNIHDKEAE